MALMTPQAISSVITPSFTTPGSSDTIAYQSGLILYVKNGATSSTVTIVVPGNQEYVGSALPDLAVTFSNGDRAFVLPQLLVDTSTQLITVTYSSTATVTSALLKI